MSKEEDEAQREREKFREFANRSNPLIVLDSIVSRDYPEPDILCEISGKDSVAFELKEICDKSLAKYMDYVHKTDDPGVRFLYLDSSDHLREFLERVRGKNYTSDSRIELLFYADERYGLPPDVIIPTIKFVFTAESHCFERVWFMGGSNESCGCVVEV